VFASSPHRRKSTVTAEFQLSMLKASLNFNPHIVGSQGALQEDEEEEEVDEEEAAAIFRRKASKRRSLGENAGKSSTISCQ
jgi:hypothetical protein